MQNPTVAKARTVKGKHKSNHPAATTNHQQPDAATLHNNAETAGSLPFTYKRWFVANPRVQESALND